MATRNLATEYNSRRDAFIDLMASPNPPSASEAWRQAGYSANGANVNSSRALAKPEIREAIATRKREIANASKRGPEHIVTALWAEVTGQPDATPASRVAALRTLADVHGLLGGQQAELPAGLDRLLVALAERAATPQPPSPVTIEARVTETR